MKPLKNAHKDGHTRVCYDSSGGFILTGGTDGKVCIWEGRDDSDTTTVNVGDKVYALAFQGGRFFAATDENAIRIHTFPDGVSDGLVTRFTSPCRCFCLSADGSLLIAGADDFKIKVILVDESECICLFTEHKAPILSLSLDPQKEFAASASCDGTIKIWGIDDGATEKSLDILTKCNEVNQTKSFYQTCWSRDGEFLLIPVDTEIHICLRSSWEVIKKITHQDINQTINTMIMSIDGTYIAFGCTNGDMGIYEWQSSKLVDKHSHPKHLPITCMSWNPKRIGEIAFCDNMGQLGFLDTVMQKDEKTDATESTTFDDVDEDMLVTASSQNPGEDADLNEINKFLDDGDDENSIDIGSIKRSLLPPEDMEDAASVASGKVEETLPVLLRAPPAPLLPPPQAPFQPGSTPEHLSSRFMVWNSIGIVRQYVSEDENSIDVEFHDTATHHALHIDNKNDYVMADLSSQAVLLASRGVEDLPSKLFCMHFGSWDNHKEWAYEVPEKEEIQAITVTDQWAAVATSNRTLRIFSISGLQQQLISLAGDVVTLASHGDRLLVVYHRGVTSPQGGQCLGIDLMRVGRGGLSRVVLINNEALPMSPASKLTWAGFSEENVPFYMDSEGIVRSYDRKCWVPVSNTRQHAKGKSDHHWLVSISARQQQIRCVPCKGSRFPATLPRPALAVLPLQLPLCDPESEKSKYEEAFQLSSMMARLLSGSMYANDDGEKAVREALVKLFAFAAKSERDFRALEVCEMMGDQSLLQIATTYATRLRRIQLAERVSECMHLRQENGVEDEDDDVESQSMELDNGQSEMLNGRDADNDVEPVDAEQLDTMDEAASFRVNSGTLLITAKAEKGGASAERPNRSLNPFKVAGSAERKSLKGSQIFDKMEKTIPKAAPIFAPLPVSIKKSGKKATSNQMKLLNFKKESSAPAPVKQEKLVPDSQEEVSENQPVKKKASAFELWFEANRKDVRAAHPEEDEEDLGQRAAEDFRALSKEDRQIWVQKAKETCTPDLNKKRKLSAETQDQQDGSNESTNEKKKKTDAKTEKKAPLSQATNAKLARFAKSD